MKLDTIRGLVRPLVTLGAFVVISALALMSKVTPTEYVALMGPFIGYWFATRTGNGAGGP